MNTKLNWITLLRLRVFVFAWLLFKCFWVKVKANSSFNPLHSSVITTNSTSQKFLSNPRPRSLRAPVKTLDPHPFREIISFRGDFYFPVVQNTWGQISLVSWSQCASGTRSFVKYQRNSLCYPAWGNPLKLVRCQPRFLETSESPLPVLPQYPNIQVLMTTLLSCIISWCNTHILFIEFTVDSTILLARSQVSNLRLKNRIWFDSIDQGTTALLRVKYHNERCNAASDANAHETGVYWELIFFALIHNAILLDVPKATGQRCQSLARMKIKGDLLPMAHY